MPPPPPTIALLFLTIRDHPHQAAWRDFFDRKNPHAKLFKAYTHAKQPSAVRSDSFLRTYGDVLPDGARKRRTTRRGRRVSTRKHATVSTRWGHLVHAYYVLLCAALHDPARPQHVRFVYVSDACVPFGTATDVYTRLMAHPNHTLLDRPRPHDNLDRYDPQAQRLARAGIQRAHFIKHSGWFALCRKDAARLAREKQAFLALNRVKAGDEHILSILMRPKYGKGASLRDQVVTFVRWDYALAAKWTPDAAGFWDAIDHEPDPQKKNVLRRLYKLWRAANMHPVTFTKITPADRAAFVASGCCFVRKVGAGVKVV